MTKNASRRKPFHDHVRKSSHMKSLTILLTAVVAVGVLYAICPSCAKPSASVSDEGAQNGAKTESVTFHVVGMKKTA